MAANILTGMPRDAPQSEVELVELRVLDGPNRFFTRPAVKLEFRGEAPGDAAAVARLAAAAVRALHVRLDLPSPRTTRRHSADRRRTVIAYPWRRRTISQAIGAAAARVALGRSTERREVSGLRAVAMGALPALPRARIPIVAITGTNGKSTTTRLIAHVATVAGMNVGMTNSDGIHIRGELVEAGDWTGFGGATRILAERGLDLAVLETARGGILLRGIGYSANDVSVVTNVSADHLGLHGVDTVEELADVKSAVVRITRRNGWAVLNAEDPLVWEMRHRTNGRLYPFSLSPRAAGIGEALDAGGRAAVLERGWLVLRAADRASRRLAQAAELPVTVAGLSRYNVANALAAAAASDALGIDPDRIAEGLRSFGADSATNPGRLNLFERRGVFAMVDFAHNEAGLVGLLDVARAVARGRSVRLGFGTAGDRTDEILHRIGLLAAKADDLVIAEKRHYLRGRDLDEMNEILRRAALEGGYQGEIAAAETEVAALRTLVDRAKRGDVCAVMAHVERGQLFRWLESEGFRQVTLKRLREVVGRA
jgi:cyanophycin synthetase